MALTLIQQVRLNTQDNTPGLYIISDAEIEYLLEKNNNNVNRASVEAARIILFNLSMRTDETVDVFSIRGSQSSKAYMEALKLYIRDPNLNQVGNNLQGYVGGISLEDMQANDANLDNNIFINPTNSPYNIPSSTDQYFGV
jgi:hypothetical protein